ncbi:hypothetical protein AHF37_04644 [Paragonimus kellicotti]|nr:hypothetical protein AHF37_04644 [Paragonimus kellicotti]
MLQSNDRSEVSHLEHQLRSQILRLSRDYVSVLSTKQSALSDGPYTADNTAYDLKKTLSVLINDMMQRMETLETEVYSLKHTNNVISSSPAQQSSRQKSHLRRNIQSVDFVGRVRSSIANVTSDSRGDLGLNERKIEDYCPTIEQRRVMLQCPRANVNYDLDALLQLIPTDNSHQSSHQFISDRLKRLWPQLVDGMREYARWNEQDAPIYVNQPGDYPCHHRPVRATDYYSEKDYRIGQPLFHNRPKLRIHLHLGFISLMAKMFFDTSIGRAHSPDNTFLGFIAEVINTSTTSYTSVSGKPRALVYGKQFYMWKDVENYLLVLNETFELHGNVVDLGEHSLPRFVRNHGVTYGTAYLDLLKSVQVSCRIMRPCSSVRFLCKFYISKPAFN